MQDVTIRQRSNTLLEIKIRHDPKGLTGPRRFRSSTAEMAFFFPQSFYVTPETYDKAAFFSDRKVYVRLDTPVFTFKSFLDDKNEVSPLFRLRRFSADGRNGPKPATGEFVHDAKLFAIVFRSLLRRVTQKIVSLAAMGNTAACEKVAKRTLKRGEIALNTLHAVIEAVLSSPELAGVHQSAKMVDEHASLLFERYLLQLLHGPSSPDFVSGLRARIVAMVANEMRYRQHSGYESTTFMRCAGTESENYVYREKALRRYAAEVLFPRVVSTDQTKQTEHLLYAPAAGVAMAFATAIAFFGQSVFGNISVSLFLLLVAGYMLKDRIKDIFRELFVRSIGRRFFDRRKNIYASHDGTMIAQLRERVAFVREENADAEMVRVRDKAPFDAEIARLVAESQLLYTKALKIDTKHVQRLQDRAVGMVDITIVNIAAWLRHLSVQTGQVPVFAEGGDMTIEEVERVYHLNLIVRLTSRQRHLVRRYRLVVGRYGISRIENVHERTSPPA